MLNTKDGCVHVADYKYCYSVPIMALVSTQWRQGVIKREKASLPVDVCRSKTSLLKLPRPSPYMVDQLEPYQKGFWSPILT